MTTRKFAVAFPSELHAHAHQPAEAAGQSLSAWLAQAAEDELRLRARIAHRVDLDLDSSSADQ
jgi:predicted HicB family RNase H-like nuclease